jgi:hypothetical protein
MDSYLYPTDFSEALAWRLYLQERETVHQPYEVLYAYRPNGQMVFRKHGHAKAISLALADIDLARESVLTHNHPEVSTFSVDDLDRAYECRLLELRAVDRRWIYRLRDPGGWYIEKRRPLLLALGRGAMEARIGGMKDKQECNHAGWLAAADAVGMTYSRNAWTAPLLQLPPPP